MHDEDRSRTHVRDTLTGSADAAWRARLGERTLDQLGWTRAARRLDPDLLDHHDRSVARVARVDRGGHLLTAGGAAPPRHLHDRTGTDDRVVVGDWVVVERDDAVAIVERSGLLARRDAVDSLRPRLVAANVDVVLVAEALDPDRTINAARVARFAAIARASDIDVHVLLTGVDRLDDRSTVPPRIAGEPAIATSIVDGTGIDSLRALLEPGSTAVVVGASGAGKSSLVNALLDEPLLAVGERRATGTGRHTTAVSRLVPLPGGALLVDTPGVRLVGMHADVGVVGAAPGMIDELADGCRFRDCRHAGEPGCAVAEAIDRGELDGALVESWQKLEREARYELARADARLHRELREQQRRQGRAYTRARRRGEFGNR